MKKNNDQLIFILLLVLAVGLFLVVYFVPIQNTNEEISSYEKKNSALRTEISELQVYHDNKSQYETDTETLKREITNVVSGFPSGYRVEDYILEGIAMENVSDFMQSSAIRISEPETLVEIDEERMKNADIEGLTDKIEFVKQSVDYSNELTYGSLKQAIEEVFRSGYRVNVESVTYTKDEEGVVLNGVIKLSYYYVNGNGREYNPPYIQPYEAGTDNIFIGGHKIDLTDYLPTVEDVVGTDIELEAETQTENETETTNE